MRLTSPLGYLFLFAAAEVFPARPSPSRDARIEDLVRQMTLEEKSGQLNQFSAGQPTGPGTHRDDYDTMIAAGRVGSLLNVTRAEQVNHYQRIAVERSRLHIPLLFGLDVIHGFRTIFPVNLGLSATWDPELIEETSRVAAKEAAAQAICLADEVATLYDWLRQDILAVAGPDYRTRCELLDFVVLRRHVSYSRTDDARREIAGNLRIGGIPH